MRENNSKVSGPIIQSKANDFAALFDIKDFECSAWGNRWRERHRIIWASKEHGEAASVDKSAVKEWISKLKGLCEGYKDEDIFNADETGLFYELQPSGTMKFKHESCSGGKLSKLRVSILFAASMTGEKLQPVFIGKSLNPRCLKNVNRKNLGVIYKSNASSWMTTIIFNEWLKCIDSKLDNFSGHKITIPLTNIKCIFFPPNSTSTIQPMDQGIIANFKHFYPIKYH